jgi:integrase
MWYGDYNDADGKRCRRPLSTDKVAAQVQLTQILTKIERQKAGIIDKIVDCLEEPVATSIADYEEHLKSKGRAEKHISETIRLVRNALDELGCEVLSDVQRAEDKLDKYLATRRKAGASHRTINADLTAVRSYCRWLIKKKRLNVDPTVHLEKLDVELDRRRKRRPLTDEEATKLFQTTLGSELVFRGLSGLDRAMLYMLAQRTGLRRHELLTLLPKVFNLDADLPTVRVEAKNAKGRKEDILPLPAEVAKELAQYLKDKPRTTPIWPGNWWEESAEMFRTDLTAADIPIVDENGTVLDFHGQRTTFITGLARAGVSPAKAQKLARHSDVNLTMKTYTHLQVEELAGAVESLPSLRDGKQLREKGAEGGAAFDPELERLNELWPKLSLETRQAIAAIISTGAQSLKSSSSNANASRASWPFHKLGDLVF